MKILTYISSLFLGGFVYLLFAAYMTGSAGLNSANPLISVAFAILIFGFLSWFHFFKPKTGALLLTIAFVVMYLTWPVHLLIEYFLENGYKPELIEIIPPILLGFSTIFLAWKSKNSDLNKWLKLALAIPPTILGFYVGGYMAYQMI
ncbi:hypothetical protein [Aegicerativicinus sediminis]|uniref:hypothetical protein n=1 Tax=Aegicerativicinus sediminis TaxID=2893202 RepID=UPI001E47E7E1|nr:hypothetical protein [Aegicerativicinus sediminis]